MTRVQYFCPNENCGVLVMETKMDPDQTLQGSLKDDSVITVMLSDPILDCPGPCKKRYWKSQLLRKVVS